MRKLLIVGLMAVALSACAGTASTRATNGLAIACDTYSAALDQLTPLKAAGKLSASNIAKVDTANSYVKPLCGSGSIVDPASAVSIVQNAIQLVTTIRSN